MVYSNYSHKFASTFSLIPFISMPGITIPEGSVLMAQHDQASGVVKPVIVPLKDLDFKIDDQTLVRFGYKTAFGIAQATIAQQITAGQPITVLGATPKSFTITEHVNAITQLGGQTVNLTEGESIEDIVKRVNEAGSNAKIVIVPQS